MAKRVSAIDGGGVWEVETLSALVNGAENHLDKHIQAIQDCLNALEMTSEFWNAPPELRELLEEAKDAAEVTLAHVEEVRRVVDSLKTTKPGIH